MTCQPCKRKPGRLPPKNGAGLRREGRGWRKEKLVKTRGFGRGSETKKTSVVALEKSKGLFGGTCPGRVSPPLWDRIKKGKKEKLVHIYRGGFGTRHTSENDLLQMR